MRNVDAIVKEHLKASRRLCARALQRSGESQAISHSRRNSEQKRHETGQPMQGIANYSFLPAFVLGFHGTDASITESVFSGKVGHLSSSQNRYDWLGTGVYFWEGSPTRALEFAELSMRQPSRTQGRIRKPAVIGAVIDLGNCLDLLDAQYFDLVREAHEELQKVMRAAGLPMPINRLHGRSRNTLLRNLDCDVINYIHELRKQRNLDAFDTVRAAFLEGEPLYEGGSFYDQNHIQICVCNHDCIKGYFRPIMNAMRVD